LKYYIPAILCGILIFWLSVTSGANFPETFKDLFSSDKIGHGIAYGTLSFLLFWGFQKSKESMNILQMTLLAASAAFYGFIMELIQYYFFPGRYFEVLDILANIMGIVITYMIFKLFFNKTTAA